MKRKIAALCLMTAFLAIATSALAKNLADMPVKRIQYAQTHMASIK